jgi:two-component system, cell cycle sensor histidine kinase and response regulator CckA
MREPKRGGGGDTIRARVLVIDDDEAMRLSMAAYLEDRGHIVDMAADGEEGLDLVLRARPDVVLLDLRMPGMDGLEVLERLRGAAPGTPAVVISGMGGLADAIEALRLGAWDYLVKPIGDLSILGHSVDKALERSRLIEENRRHQEHLEEEIARRTEELRRYEYIVAATADQVTLFDSDYVYRAANDAYLRAYGKRREEVIGHSLFDLFDRDVFLMQMKGHLERCLGGKMVDCQGWQDFPALGRRFMDFACRPYRDSTGAVAGVVVSARDMTNLKQVQDELAASEARLRLIADTIDDVFWMRTWPDLRVAFVSRAYERIWGHEAEEVCRNPSAWVDGVHEADRDGVLNAFAKLANGDAYDEEYRVVDAGGEVRWVRDRGIPIRGPSGDVERVVGVAQDITEHRQAEATRLQLERQMLQTQKFESLGVLAGGVAHDFNNILMAVMGNVDLALGELPPGAPVRSRLQEIEKASRRAAVLASQMLTYSGKGRFAVEPIDLSEFVKGMDHLFRASVSKKATLEFRLAVGLPCFYGDANQIRQAVMNLVVNASEALSDGGGVVRIATGAMDCDRDYLSGVEGTIQAEGDELFREGRYVYVEVYDTGCGMDGDTLAKVFDPFFTTKFTGRGLGMAAVLGIVRGHHGTIKIDSDEGKGTTVRVLLPASGNGEGMSRLCRV